MDMRLESQVEEEFIKHLGRKGITHARMKTTGWPDLLCITNEGKIFFVELKRHYNNKYKPTPKQIERVKFLNERGIPAFFVYGNFNLQSELEKILKKVNSKNE